MTRPNYSETLVARETAIGLADAPVSQRGSFSRADFGIAAIVALVSAYVFFFRLGNFGVMDGGESYYPAAVREMIESHSYIVPQMNYQLYFSKPIMTFWLLEAGYHLFGMTEFGGRFFAALGGWLLSLSMFAVTRALANSRAAAIASLLFAGSPFVLAYFRTSSVDAFFTTFLGFAFCALLAVVGAGKSKWWPAIYVALGLAILTKGPAALVLSGAGLLVTLAALRLPLETLKYWLRKMHPFKGTAILLAVALPWYLAVGAATKWLFLKVFLLYENLGRFKGQTNPRPTVWWRYPVVLAVGLLPWSLLLPASVAGTVSRVRARLSASRSDQCDLSIDTPTIDVKIVCLCFSATVIGLFAASKTQMEPYILPAVPPLAIAVALFCEEWSKRISGIGRWSLDKLNLAAFIVGPLLPVGFIIAACTMHGRAIPIWCRIALPIVSLLVGAIWFCQRRFLKGRLVDSILAIGVSSAILSGTFVAAMIETFYFKSHRSLHNLCRLVRGSKDQVALFGAWRPSVLYYTCGPVNCFYRTEQLKKSDDPANRVYILTRRGDMAQFVSERSIKFHQEAVDGEWGLFRADGAYLQPYTLLSDTFSKVSVLDFVTDRYKLGIMTDPLSAGRIQRVGTLNVK
jgi:4-amino-4-deoxy-L-arabinose transferase-like glycosyltransferase